MNEVEELLKIDLKDLPPIHPIVLDDLHQKVLKNLYLELGSGPVLHLLSPSYSQLHPESERGRHRTRRRKKRPSSITSRRSSSRIWPSIRFSSRSTAISSSRTIILVLARLGERDSGGRRYEIKYLHPFAGRTPDPLRGQDLHRPRFRRPFQFPDGNISASGSSSPR